MYACGYNAYGQIGQGQVGIVYNVFTEIEGLQGNVVDIYCQGYASETGFTALKENGSCFTWGYGGGYQIPEDDAASFYTPKPILF
jgi:alpha-tubulin suppressor-like RCC1 family protein